MNIYRDIERRIGYRFKRKQNLINALTHPSYRHENDCVEDDNQRLEFLGDAVLDLVVAQHLFEVFQFDEGRMTKLRSNTTCTTALAEIARSIDLGTQIVFGRGESASCGGERDSNLADALEAIIGAAYLDGGIKAAHKIFRKLFMPTLDRDADIDANNPKGALQEYCQKNGMPAPQYRLIEEHGPAHDKQFLIEVRVADQALARATAERKNKAERAAAAQALKGFKEGNS